MMMHLLGRTGLYGGAPEWLPTDLGDCVLWLRSDLGTTKDAENRVSNREDQSDGNDVSQATDSKKPIHQTNSGVLVDYYDGVDDRLTRSSFALNQPFTMFYTFSLAEFKPVAYHTVFCLGTNLGRSYIGGAAGFTQLSIYSGAPELHGPSLFKGLVPAMTSNTAPSPYVASASGEYTSTYAAWKAFNKDSATYWISLGEGSDEWLKIDLGTAKICRQYSVMGGHSTAYSPTDFVFQGSNNDSDWTTLDTQTGITWATTTIIKTFHFTNEVAYRYYRLYITGPATYKSTRIFYLAELSHVYYKAVTIFNGANSKIRLDGVEVAGETGTGSGTDIWLGGNGPTLNHWDGGIHEAGVYNKALNAEEIALLESYLYTSEGN